MNYSCLVAVHIHILKLGLKKTLLTIDSTELQCFEAVLEKSAGLLHSAFVANALPPDLQESSVCVLYHSGFLIMCQTSTIARVNRCQTANVSKNKMYLPCNSSAPQQSGLLCHSSFLEFLWNKTVLRLHCLVQYK